MKIRGIIVDIGGVLVQWTNAWQTRWENHLQLPQGTLEQMRTALESAAQHPPEKQLIWKQVAAKLKIEGPLLSSFLVESATPDQLNSDLASFLQQLRPYYKTAILSNAGLGAREGNDSRFGINDLVDTCMYSAEEGTQKPEERFYLLACQRLSMSPKEIVFLDDQLLYVRAAQKVGMHGILFHNTQQAINDISSFLSKERAFPAVEASLTAQAEPLEKWND
jgi:epoxide hydrolase-like predicted phosphatase